MMKFLKGFSAFSLILLSLAGQAQERKKSAQPATQATTLSSAITVKGDNGNQQSPKKAVVKKKTKQPKVKVVVANNKI